MGWFQRLFSGAPDQDGHNRDPRSPDQARVSAEDFTQELRALKDEIKLLRETLGEGGRAAPGGSDSSRGRRSRGGRSRGGSSRDRDRDRDRDQERNGKGGRRDQPPRRSLPKAPPDDAPVGLLVDYLKTRGVVVYEGQDDLNRNEAFEHLARHLGTHFDLLAEFYEKVKRCVATGRGQRIDIDNYSQAARSAAVQFGTLLHRHGMLKDFYYHRSPKKQLRVIPTKDGQIGQFLTGGWLEIYVSAVLSKRLRAAMSSAKFQMLYNVKGVLPDGREFEADLMAAVGDKFFWLECKTGNWQDYSARFRGLVKIFGVDRISGGLLLIRPPDAATRARATDMLEMTLLSLADVDDFISVFLGEEPTGDSRRHALPPGKEILEPQSEDEIPLENAPPARKLGQVDLDNEEDPGDQPPSARRRRRRRGGRGRGRRRTEGAAEGVVEGSAEAAPKTEAAAKESAPEKANGQARAPKGALLEPLPIEKFEDEAGAEAKVEESQEKPASEDQAEASDKPARPARRRRRRSSPFAEEGGEAKAASEDSGSTEEAKAATSGEAAAEDEADKPKPRRKRSRSRSRKPKAEAEAQEEGAATEEAPAETPAEAAAEEATEVVAEVAPEVEEEPEAVVEVAAEPEPEPEPEPVVKEKKSASGVTIAPDLLAMMAGSPKASGDKKEG